jgi:hypothetical protein
LVPWCSEPKPPPFIAFRLSTTNSNPAPRNANLGFSRFSCLWIRVLKLSFFNLQSRPSLKSLSAASYHINRFPPSPAPAH